MLERFIKSRIPTRTESNQQTSYPDVNRTLKRGGGVRRVSELETKASITGTV
jgi:hypothetical protein